MSHCLIRTSQSFQPFSIVVSLRILTIPGNTHSWVKSYNVIPCSFGYLSTRLRTINKLFWHRCRGGIGSLICSNPSLVYLDNIPLFPSRCICLYLFYSLIERCMTGFDKDLGSLLRKCPMTFHEYKTVPRELDTQVTGSNPYGASYPFVWSSFGRR